ncbi:hypothetical protein GWO43_27830 [candidate division KSB1 bacterium]|nr:hypothetical protein [candidate division KSB1 bacterium]NIR70689.1 hypothetical protein [candidate division KSB1 bacterium]NIS27753.1 hypothetical protein [candidate division KSB1 bacterium]NIT74600.1 hypothetical protein [candidate division KSB1 bacterium]NIU28420.1 hypothetical protein [candidate division KSB1 bacterium]
MKEKRSKLPEIQSLEELADFWDEHQLTDFYEEFVEVPDVNVNIEGRTYVHVTTKMYEALSQIAEKKGVGVEQLIRLWVEEKIAERN